MISKGSRILHYYYTRDKILSVEVQGKPLQKRNNVITNIVSFKRLHWIKHSCCYRM